jgi:hypothetical protein
MSTNTPRLDYPLLDGVVQGCPTLLLEPQRTNLVTYSEDFSQSYWNKLNNVTVSSEKVISPDGTLNASQLVFDGTANGRIEKAITGLTQGADYSVSIYARVSSGTQVVNFGSVADFPYTLTTEWQRLTSTQAENDTVGYPRLKCNDDVTIEVWGFQLEKGSYPTSYIPSLTGSQTTRSADDCVDAGTASDFNDSEGVLYVNAKIDDPSEADDNNFSLGDGSFISNSVEISFKNLSASSQSIVGSCVIDGSSLSITPTTITDASIKHDLFHKVAYQYKQADFKMFVNGFKIGTSTYNDIFSSGALQRVSFEGNGTANTKFRGNTREVMTFNTAMTDAQMEELTSYESFNQMATEQLYTIE